MVKSSLYREISFLTVLPLVTASRLLTEPNRALTPELWPSGIGQGTLCVSSRRSSASHIGSLKGDEGDESKQIISSQPTSFTQGTSHQKMDFSPHKAPPLPLFQGEIIVQILLLPTRWGVYLSEMRCPRVRVAGIVLNSIRKAGGIRMKGGVRRKYKLSRTILQMIGPWSPFAVAPMTHATSARIR